MQCPVCNKEMTAYQEELCYSTKKGVVYKRTRYMCQDDDVWGRVEAPQGKLSQEQQALLSLKG